MADQLTWSTCGDWLVGSESGPYYWLPGCILILFLHTMCVGLHLVLPAYECEGYCVDLVTGKPMIYRLNGFRTLVAVAALWVILFRINPALATLAVDRFEAVVFTSNAVGIVFSAFFIWRARNFSLVDTTMRCWTKDQPKRPKGTDVTATQSAATVFFLGLEFNPKLPPNKTFDVKVFLSAQFS